jgi:lipoteichoic acid synthase
LFNNTSLNPLGKFSIKNNIKINFQFIYKDVLFFITLLSLFLKSILFILLINSEKATKFKEAWAFYGDAHILVYLCFIAIFLSFSFLFKNKGKLLYFLIINLIFTFILISDLWYFRGFNSFITLHVLNQTSNLNNLSSDIFSMMRTIDIIFVIDFLVLIPLSLLLRKLYSTQKRLPSFFLLIFLISIGYIWFAHYKIDIVEKGQKTILFRICWTPTQTMANLSPIGYHIYDAFNYWEDCQPYNLSTTDKKDITTWFNDKKETLPDNEYKGLFKGKNLILIQIESLENFVINQKINNQEITPNLNKLLKNSFYFNNYFEQVYNGTTSDAELMTNTSVYPVRRGSTFFRYPYNSYNSLPKLMQGMDYSTIALHPDKGSYWNWMPALTSIGFQKTVDETSYKMDESLGLGLSDGSFLRQAEPIIAQQKQPFYSFMITLTSHGPFDLPKEYRELNLDSKLDETKLGGYFQSIHYTDKHIGIFLDKLEKDGLLDNSIVVLYGDHTGIHKYYEDEVSKIQPQEDWWQHNDMRIPLIIYEKGMEGKKFSNYGGQVDLMPSLAYLMGANTKTLDSTAIGKNLFNTNKSFAVLADGKYVGVSSSEKEKNNAIQGIDIADKIIRSNYFKETHK